MHSMHLRHMETPRRLAVRKKDRAAAAGPTDEAGGRAKENGREDEGTHLKK